MLYVCLLLIWLATCACAEENSRAVRISVSSRRNKTGHWRTQVVWDHEAVAPELDNRETPPLLFDVEQRVTNSRQGETLSMKAVVTASPSLPIKGYGHYPGLGRYKFHTTPLVWTDAQQICSDEGAHLAVVNSKAEEDVLKKLFAAHPQIQNTTWNEVIWLGLHDLNIEGDFFTVQAGDPLSSLGYTNWGPNQPSNQVYPSYNSDSDCGGLRRTATMCDLPCTAKYAFICEQAEW